MPEVSPFPSLSPLSAPLAQSALAQTPAGTPGNDLLNGGPGADRLVGGDGNDTINGRDGVDRLYGGDGDDLLDGGFYHDACYGQAGNDTFRIRGVDLADDVYGGAGTDTLDLSGYTNLRLGFRVDLAAGRYDFRPEPFGPYVVKSIEIVIGSARADVLLGSRLAETLSGGLGNDRLEGRGGADVLRGMEGADALFGGTGNDLLLGGAGNDRLDGQWERDVLVGGAGNDIPDRRRRGGPVRLRRQFRPGPDPRLLARHGRRVDRPARGGGHHRLRRSDGEPSVGGERPCRDRGGREPDHARGDLLRDAHPRRLPVLRPPGRPRAEERRPAPKRGAGGCPSREMRHPLANRHGRLP